MYCLGGGGGGVEEEGLPGLMWGRGVEGGGGPGKRGKLLFFILFYFFSCCSLTIPLSPWMMSGWSEGDNK